LRCSRLVMHLTLLHGPYTMHPNQWLERAVGSFENKSRIIGVRYPKKFLTAQLAFGTFRLGNRRPRK